MQASTFLYVRKPWYSYSPFVDLLHMTPAVYSRRLRLSKQIVIPERQARLQPCCKFLSLSHIFQHPPVYANRRMFFSFSSWKAQRALCWANHSAKAADFRRSTAFQALKIFIAHRSPGFLLPYITLQKGSVIPNSIPFTGDVSARTQSNAALFVLRRRCAEFMNKMSVKSRHIGIPHLGGYIRHRKIRLQQKLCADGTP